MAVVPERRLTTILSADVAGYSRLMELDEAGTLARLKDFRDAFSTRIADHRGRLVSTSGDALLAEFASVVNAVDCAARVQRDLSERNAGLRPEDRMIFRIGINLGDVMVENDDLFGEGVNVAARLQSLAEPGGILISGAVFEQVRNKLSLGFDYLGPQTVKNISESVPTYRVLLGDGEEAAATVPRQQPAIRQPDMAGGSYPSSGQTSAGDIFPRALLLRRAAIAGSLIAFLFAINMLSSSDRLWFQWPAIVILLILALRTAAPSRIARSPRERLQRRALVAGSLVVFLFAINMLTFQHVFWFQYPTSVILLLFALRTFWVGWRDEA